MAVLETSHIDLECGATVESDENDSVCFSDDDSCNSQFYSTAGDNSYDDYSFACGSEINLENDEDSESRRDSSVSDCCSVDIENGENTIMDMDYKDRDCRICHLSLVSNSPSSNGIAIELGCFCKDDLAAAHKHCAETWFKIKGNKTCEICNSIARNVVGPNDNEIVQQGNESSVVEATTPLAPTTTSNIENRRFLHGHRFLNFLLACMVFAFVISWLFHFNIPS